MTVWCAGLDESAVSSKQITCPVATSKEIYRPTLIFPKQGMSEKFTAIYVI
jgi:hypothetical protein